MANLAVILRSQDIKKAPNPEGIEAYFRLNLYQPQVILKILDCEWFFLRINGHRPFGYRPKTIQFNS